MVHNMKYYLREENITESLVDAIKNLFARKTREVVREAPATMTQSHRESEIKNKATAKAKYHARKTPGTQGEQK